MADISSSDARIRKPLLSVKQSPEAMEAAMWKVVNAWDIERRVRGHRPADRRIKRADADRLLSLALKALGEGRHG